MNIVVCVAQVIKSIDGSMGLKTRLIRREDFELVNNPYDLYAVEEGLLLKEKYGGSVTTISMSPPQCEINVRELIAMGVDRAVLMSSPDFSGSDTAATSYILSQGIRNIGGFDLIITGQRSADGNTGHVGPGVAELLKINHLTDICKIVEIQNSEITLQKEIDNGSLTISSLLPVLITVTPSINKPRMPTIGEMIKAKNRNVLKMAREHLLLQSNKIGLEGSATKILRQYTPVYHRKVKKFRFHKNRECVATVLSELDLNGKNGR